MPTTLQFRRGSTSEIATQTGAVGELFVDTTKDTVVVHDGSTQGGFPLQQELVSGTNIKTINSSSLLGSGNIAVQSTLVSGTNIKTINGVSILGSGNISIQGGEGGGGDFIANLDGSKTLTINSNDEEVQLSTDYNFTTSSFEANKVTVGVLDVKSSPIEIGTVLLKETVPPSSVATTYASFEEFFNAASLNYGYFYSSYAQIYTYSTLNSSITNEFFAVGKTIRLSRSTEQYWDLQITAYTNYNSYVQIEYTITDFVGADPSPSMNAYFDTSTSGTINSTTNYPERVRLTLSQNFPTEYSAIYINGELESEPQATQITANSDYSISSWDMIYNDEAFLSSMLNEYSVDEWLLLKVGQQITLTNSNNEVLVATVSSLPSEWPTSQPSGSFSFNSAVRISYVSGVKITNALQISGEVLSSINYYDSFGDSNTDITDNIILSSTKDYINVEDSLSYVPLNSSISFKDAEGNGAISIQYNNLTNQLTYGGITEPLKISQSGSVFTSNSRNIDPGYPIGDQALSIGFFANSTNSVYGIALGAYSNASTNGSISIGGNSFVSNGGGISIGQDATTSGGSDGGVAIGRSALSSGGIAIGYNVSADLTQFKTGYQFGLYTVQSNISTATAALTANTLRYITNGNSGTSTFSNSTHDLARIIGRDTSSDSRYHTMATLNIECMYKVKGVNDDWVLFNARYIAEPTGSNGGNYTWNLIQLQQPTITAQGAGHTDTTSLQISLTNNRYLQIGILNNNNRSVAVRASIDAKNLRASN